MPELVDLRGLTILVTRPKPQGEMLVEKIRESGGNAIFFPTIAFMPVNSSQSAKMIEDLSRYDWLIFVSPQSVYQFHQLCRTLPSSLQIAAVGSGTAEVLNQLHWGPVVYPPIDMGSDALLSLPELQSVTGKTIAIVKGEGGRQLLEEELRQRGATVVSIIVYRRVLPTDISREPYIDLLHKNGLDVIICTAIESVKNLKILLEKAWLQLQNVTLLVVSKRIADYAKQSGFTNILQAKNASHQAILTACKEKLR